MAKPLVVSWKSKSPFVVGKIASEPRRVTQTVASPMQNAFQLSRPADSVRATELCLQSMPQPPRLLRHPVKEVRHQPQIASSLRDQRQSVRSLDKTKLLIRLDLLLTLLSEADRRPVDRRFHALHSKSAAMMGGPPRCGRAPAARELCSRLEEGE